MTTPEIQEVAEGGLTEDQAVQAMLAKHGPKPDDEEQASEAETTDKPEAEQSEQDDADAEGEKEAEAEGIDDIEIDVGGEKFKLPPQLAEQAKRIEAKVKDLEAGTTRKFQEAADLRKVAEKQIEAAQQLQQIAHEQSDLIADHKMVERRLAALERIDVNALAESDPVQLTKINAEYNQLMSAKSRIESQYKQSVQQSQDKFKETHQAKVVQLNDFAKRNIKGWSDDYSDQLMQFSVKTLGFDPGVLRTTLNEPLMRAIDLAFQGHKVRTADPKAKIVNINKTLKPGGAQVQTTAHANAEKARLKARRSGTVEDAAMAMLARAQIRKR